MKNRQNCFNINNHNELHYDVDVIVDGAVPGQQENPRDKSLPTT
jgi:hypothetical protein